MQKLIAPILCLMIVFVLFFTTFPEIAPEDFTFSAAFHSFLDKLDGIVGIFESSFEFFENLYSALSGIVDYLKEELEPLFELLKPGLEYLEEIRDKFTSFLDEILEWLGGSEDDSPGAISPP